MYKYYIEILSKNKYVPKLLNIIKQMVNKKTIWLVLMYCEISTVDNFNKVLAEMIKHAFPAYAFREQKRYLYRHLVKLRSMILHSFISRLQDLNACLEELPPDTEGQETAPLPADKIMDIIYHTIPTTWKNKIIEQGFNNTQETAPLPADESMDIIYHTMPTT